MQKEKEFVFSMIKEFSERFNENPIGFEYKAIKSEQSCADVEYSALSVKFEKKDGEKIYVIQQIAVPAVEIKEDYENIAIFFIRTTREAIAEVNKKFPGHFDEEKTMSKFKDICFKTLVSVCAKDEFRKPLPSELVDLIIKAKVASLLVENMKKDKSEQKSAKELISEIIKDITGGKFDGRVIPLVMLEIKQPINKDDLISIDRRSQNAPGDLVIIFRDQSILDQSLKNLAADCVISSCEDDEKPLSLFGHPVFTRDEFDPENVTPAMLEEVKRRISLAQENKLNS